MKKRHLAIALILFIIAVLAYVSIKTTNNKEEKFSELSKGSDFDIIIGSYNSELTLVMYYSYNCIHCRNFFNNTLPEIEDKYINTNKLKIVLKPVDLTKNELISYSLQTLVCLNRFGNPEHLHNLLLAEPTIAQTKRFKEITDEFIEKDENLAECLLSNESREYLLNNSNLLYLHKINGTPVFIINNKIIKGYKEFSVFKQIIEDELNKIQQ